jgi:hypothetical protein
MIGPSPTTVKVHCNTCCVCGKSATLEVPIEGYKKWQSGAHVQDAFPAMPPDQRELLISGTHPKCWDELTEVRS